jgi:hypothetical protein
VSTIDHAGIEESGHALGMASETLSLEEFASLLLVGNKPANGSAPAIPAAHSARLIALATWLTSRVGCGWPRRDDSGYMLGRSPTQLLRLLWMKRQLLSQHPLNQFLDPINHLLIRDEGRRVPVMLDLLVNLNALLTHGSPFLTAFRNREDQSHG